MLLRALADGVIALAARQSGWFSVRTTREFAFPAAPLAKVVPAPKSCTRNRVPASGNAYDFIVELILAGGFNLQPKFARPDRHSDRPFERRRAGKHAGIGGRGLRRERDQPVAIFADERERRSVADGNPD
jgi:hypothetical protein